MFVVIDDDNIIFDDKKDLLNYLYKRFGSNSDVKNIFNGYKDLIELYYNDNRDFIYVKNIVKHDDFKNNYNLYLDIGNILKCFSKILN